MFRDGNRATTFAGPIVNDQRITGQPKARSAYGVPALPAVPGQIACLAAMALFRDLSSDELKIVSQSAFTMTAPRGTIIYRPGETAEVLYLLLKGSVHLHHLSLEGRKLIVQTISPMHFFGEMPLVTRRLQNLFAEAAEDCTLCIIRKPDFERMMLWKPQVGMRMLEEVGHRGLEVQDRLSESVFEGLPARLASRLLRGSSNGTYPLKGLTHQCLADMLGACRETVTLVLNGLRDKGMIKLGRKEIVILRPDQLRQVAEKDSPRRGREHMPPLIKLVKGSHLSKAKFRGTHCTNQSSKLTCKQPY
jgi:CRP/FNR family transcriptional regulator, cyclic AMP receptor protein